MDLFGGVGNLAPGTTVAHNHQYVRTFGAIHNSGVVQQGVQKSDLVGYGYAGTSRNARTINLVLHQINQARAVITRQQRAVF